jgi:hypothetical protein
MVPVRIRGQQIFVGLKAFPGAGENLREVLMEEALQMRVGVVANPDVKIA